MGLELSHRTEKDLITNIRHKIKQKDVKEEQRFVEIEDKP